MVFASSFGVGTSTILIENSTIVDDTQVCFVSKTLGLLETQRSFFPNLDMSFPKVNSNDNEKNQLEQLKCVFCYPTTFIIGIKKMHPKLQDNK